VLGNLLVVAVYGLFILYLLRKDRLVVRGRTYAFLTLGVVYVLIAVNVLYLAVTDTVLSSFLLTTLVAAVALVFITVVNVFVLPAVIDVRFFMKVLAYVSAALVLIGIPAIIVGPYSFLWIEVRPYTHLIPFAWWGIDILALTSIFSDSTAIGKIAMFGTLASAYELSKRTDRQTRLLFGMNLLGVYLSSSRGGMTGTAIGLAIYWLYLRHGEQGVRLAVLASALGTGYVLGAIFGLFPAPEIITRTSRRLSSWYGAVNIIKANPLFGIGFEGQPAKMEYFIPERQKTGVQNSYLRVAVATGVVGGISYVAFVLRSLLSALFDHDSREKAIVTAFAIALAFLQIFEAFTIFGTNRTSVVASIVFGYIVQSLTGKNLRGVRTAGTVSATTGDPGEVPIADE